MTGLDRRICSPCIALIVLALASAIRPASAADLKRAARTPVPAPAAPAQPAPAPAPAPAAPPVVPAPAAASTSTAPTVTLVARVVTPAAPATTAAAPAPRQPAPAAVAAGPAPLTGITVARRIAAPAPAQPVASAAAGGSFAATPLPPAPRATTPAGAPVRIAAVSRPAADQAPLQSHTAPAVTGPLSGMAVSEPLPAPALAPPPATPAAPVATLPARPNAIPIAPDPDAAQPRPAATPVRAAIGPATVTTTPVAAPVIVAQVTPAPAATPAAGPVRIGPAESGGASLPTLPAPGPVAPASGPVVSLTPEAAAALALENSIDLKINAANVREAQARVRQAYGLEDFTLSAGATLGRRGPTSSIEMSTGDGETRTIELGSPDIRTVTLSLSKPLYTSGRLERAQEVAQIGAELQSSSGQIVRHALDLSARAAVYNALRLEQLVGVAQQSAAAVASHLDLSRKLQDAGVVARFEVVQAETELAQAQGRVITARTALENARAGLRRILTLDQGTSLQLSAGEQTQPPAGDQASLIALAQRQRPEVRTQEVAVRLADASVALAAKGKALSVALVGSANLDFASSGLGATDYGWQVALSAQQPILDGHATRDKVTEARAARDAARLELDKTREGIALEVTQAVLSLDDANQSLQVARQAQTEAEEQLRIARVRYESGVALGVEVLDAEAALASARANVVNAQYNVQIASSELRSAVGQ